MQPKIDSTPAYPAPDARHVFQLGAEQQPKHRPRHAHSPSLSLSLTHIDCNFKTPQICILLLHGFWQNNPLISREELVKAVKVTLTYTVCPPGSSLEGDLNYVVVF